MSELPAHVQRMTEEHSQLNDRIVKLDAFIPTGTFRGLAPEDQRLLHEQLRHMVAYRAVLNSRIARSEGSEGGVRLTQQPNGAWVAQG